MKKMILCLISIILYTTNSFSQENLPAEKSYYAYCVLYSTQLDFGLSENYWLEREPGLRNKKGKLIKFQSLVDALNYMGALGWEVVETYSGGAYVSKDIVDNTTISSNNRRLFRKEVTKKELDRINAAIREKL